jgi:hypothetical protein
MYRDVLYDLLSTVGEALFESKHEFVVLVAGSNAYTCHSCSIHAYTIHDGMEIW